MRVVFVVIATGCSISGVGIGMLLTGWHPKVGIALMVLGAAYLLYGVLTCRPLVAVVPEAMLRLLAGVMIAAFTLLIVGPDIEKTLNSRYEPKPPGTLTPTAVQHNQIQILEPLPTGEAVSQSSHTSKEKEPRGRVSPVPKMAAGRPIASRPPRPCEEANLDACTLKEVCPRAKILADEIGKIGSEWESDVNRWRSYENDVDSDASKSEAEKAKYKNDVQGTARAKEKMLVAKYARKYPRDALKYRQALLDKSPRPGLDDDSRLPAYNALSIGDVKAVEEDLERLISEECQR